MSTNDIFLEVRNLRKSFAGVRAVRGLSMAIRRGEIRALCGENGCGKSTLIKMISGVHAPDSGEIIIEGRTYTRLQPIEAIREGIQVIYQDFSLFSNLTVAENIALGDQVARGNRIVRWKEVLQVAKEAMAQIGVQLDPHQLVEELPVADKQLVAICRALVHEAKLLIMDEPTTALTDKEIRALFRVVNDLKARGISVLFVSHKLNEVLEISDHITIMRNGEKVADGPAHEFDWAKIAYYMTGREIRETTYEGPAQRHEPPLLELKGLTRTGGFEDVSLRLYPGEIVGITGALGSGRTALARALFGLEPADRGEIYMDGRPVRIRSVQDAYRHRIAYVPEDRLTQGLFMNQTIWKNVLAATFDHFRGKMGLLDSSKADEAVDGWIERLAIATPSTQQAVSTLSGGNQQRVVIAKWLQTDPRLLILNGPTVGVDIRSKAEIHQLTRRLAQDGVGILIMSDDIPELLQNCNRIIVMRHGRVALEVEARDISEAELARELIGA